MKALISLVRKWGLGLVVACLSLGASAQVLYFHNDLSGSPVLATDANGAVVWKENYRPYGERLNNETSSANNKLWFAGKPYDANTGLSYMGARYYDPVLGRFMGVDPVDYQESNIHSFNRYAYANNNPYKFVDPDGRHPVLAVLGFVVMRAGWWLAQRQAGAIMAAEFAAGVATGAVTPSVALEGAAANVVAKEARVVANGVRGRASEARVLKELGLEKNKTVVSTAEGDSIPDALTKSLSVEVKDAAKVSLTRQLRIQTEAARAFGRESVLITGENTCVSGACSRAFDNIIRRSDLGPH